MYDYSVILVASLIEVHILWWSMLKYKKKSQYDEDTSVFIFVNRCGALYEYAE